MTDADMSSPTAATATSTDSTGKMLDLPVQDKRTYHAFKLPTNGLRCLVIHDPVDETKNDDKDEDEEEENDDEDEEEEGTNNKSGGGKNGSSGHKAAVSTTVAVGQLHDGADWPGRAHLTEHLLFLGSQTFPTENELDAYLNKHGGHSNAYTDLDYTCYFMDCSSAALQGALERWAASLTAPLLDVGSVEREIQAIESEHQKNVLSDYWRFFQLSKRLMLTSKPKVTASNRTAASKHPYASFGNGCFDSLVPSSASSTAPTATTTTTTGSTTVTSTDHADEKGQEDGEKANSNDNNNKQARITALRDAVAEFVQLYYKAEFMTVTVSSSHSIDDMVKWVTLYFSDIPNSSTSSTSTAAPTLCRHDPPPVLPKLTLDDWTLPVSVQIVPTREGRTLELQWPLPREMQSLYESKPTRILSHLLGHEGPGSVLSILRQQQWAQDFCADDVSRSNRQFCIFQVQVELTTTGWQHVSDIVRLVYAYLQLLRNENGIPSWVYQELKVTADMQFRFLSQQGAMDTVSSLSVNLLQYPPKRYISGPFQFFADEAPMDLVHECLQTALVPDNMLQVVGAPEYHQEEENENATKNQKDAWYGTEYRVVDFEKGMFECWKNPNERRQSPNDDEEFEKHEDIMQELLQALHLPEPNDMLPSNFDLKKADQKYFDNKESTPRCLMDNGETMRLWYKPDTAFGMPKVNVMILLRSSLAYTASPMHAVLASMWSEVIHEICNEEFTYQASMAGLHCEFSNSRKGLSIHVSGYNHKAAILLKRVVDAANQICSADACEKTELTHELFERIQEKLEKQWLAFLVAQPYQHAMYAADLCLEQPKWHFRSQMECIKELNRDDLIRFSKQIFARMHLEVLVHGNVTAQEAKDMAQILLDGWKPSRPLTLPEMRVVQLPQQRQYAETIYRMLGWNEPDSNSVVANIYQIGEMETRENATLSVLGQLVREPAFNQLRTEEQMGYIVFSQVKTIGDNIKGLLLLVQGDTYDPIHMDERIEIFLDNFRDKVVAMPDEDFKDNIAAVCQTLLEKKKNLIEESSGYWNVILNQTYRFRRLQEIAEQAQTITKSDVLCLFDRYVLRTSPHRRRLSVQVFGCKHRDCINVNKEKDDKNGKKILWIDDPVEFARGQPLFPVQSAASLDDDLKMDV